MKQLRQAVDLHAGPARRYPLMAATAVWASWVTRRSTSARWREGRTRARHTTIFFAGGLLVVLLSFLEVGVALWEEMSRCACHPVALHVGNYASRFLLSSEYDADRRWKLRDKCLRVATYYRVMHMRERSRRTACMHRLRKLFAGWAASFLVHVRHAAARAVHEERAATTRAGRQGLVSAVTRMRPHWSAGVR